MFQRLLGASRHYLDFIPGQVRRGRFNHTGQQSLIGKVQHQPVNATGTRCSPHVLHQTGVNLLSSLDKT
jgi:hypothetical protein